MKFTGKHHKRIRNRIGLWIIGGALLLILILTLRFIRYQSGKKPKELMIAAAASMKSAMDEVLEDYRKQHPDITILITYGGSGTLEQQIRQGAPIDVFLTAAASNIDSLSKDKLIIEKTRIDLLRNKLVLIEPTDSEIKLAGFEDLRKAGKIAMGDPDSVPAGKYAYELCQFLGLWEELEDKIVYGKDVTEVLTWVASGNADAGMVYSTEASLSDQVNVVALAQEDSHSKIIYCAAVVEGTKDEKAGTELLNYLTSEKAQQIFFKYGFLPIE